jgi:hypothetical protein
MVDEKLRLIKLIDFGTVGLTAVVVMPSAVSVSVVRPTVVRPTVVRPAVTVAVMAYGSL